MLDPKYIRANKAQVKQNTEERNIDPQVVEDWFISDVERNELIGKLEEVRREKNELAEMVRKGARPDQLRNKGKELKDKEKVIQAEMEKVNMTWETLIHQIPNIHPQGTPLGKTDSENVELRQVGEKPRFDFEPKDHLEIGEELGILDFEAGAKVAGSQFYFLKGDAALLEMSLMQYGMQFLSKKGYLPTITPDLARSRFYQGTGYAPRGDEAQTYEIAGEDLGLIATAEVTMAAMHADDVLPQDSLPLKFAALSHCFRREGGSYGKYSKGLYRVHQFSKLEMFVYCLPEHSDKLHHELLAIEEELMQSLGIPYRVLEMCTGDLGAMAAKKYDLEAWMPGRNDWGEITSTSNTTDFQARNLNIKFKSDTGKNEYLHMLNGTAIVGSRIPVAILENFQQEDGTVRVPEVLVPYMGKEVISRVT